MSNIVPFPQPTDIERATEMALQILRGVRERAGAEKAAELAMGFIVGGAAVVTSEHGTDARRELFDVVNTGSPYRRGRRRRRR